MSETLNCRESSARFGSPRIASEIAAESTVSFPGDAGAGDRLTARGLAEGGDLGDDDLAGGVIDADVLPIVEGFSIDFRGEALGGATRRGEAWAARRAAVKPWAVTTTLRLRL